MKQTSPIRLVIVFALCCMLLATSGVANANDTGPIHWKPVDEAQVKIDGKTPLAWNVYQPDKKKDANLVLILLGHRYLAFDIKAKQVYLVFLRDLHAQGKDFETDDVMQASRVIPSSDWSLRDIGPAESIKLTLGDYGRTVDIQLPHMPDLRRGIY
jgi:hypothetical protein